MSSDFLKTKAREICYAVARVAYYVKRSDLKQRLETASFNLLENTAAASVDSENKPLLGLVFQNIASLESLVKIGHSLYEIEPMNANILVRELDSLNSAIRQFGNLDLSLPDLNSLFSGVPAMVSVSQDYAPVDFKSDNSLNDLSKDIRESNGHANGNGNGNGINMAIRQSAIINRIKNGNGNGCRLKDLLAEFPDVSERTLRYDLQKLCDQKMIERIGNGGPSSYYRYIGDADLKAPENRSGERNEKGRDSL